MYSVINNVRSVIDEFDEFHHYHPWETYIVNCYGYKAHLNTIDIIYHSVHFNIITAEEYFQEEWIMLGTEYTRIELLDITDGRDPEILSAREWTQDDYDDIDDEFKDNYINPSDYE